MCLRIVLMLEGRRWAGGGEAVMVVRSEARGKREGWVRSEDGGSSMREGEKIEESGQQQRRLRTPSIKPFLVRLEVMDTRRYKAGGRW